MTHGNAKTSTVQIWVTMHEFFHHRERKNLCKLCILAKIFFLIWFAAFQPLTVQAEIIKTLDLLPLQAALSTAPPETLVCFDIDDVLIVPKDSILRSRQRGRLEKYTKKIASRMSKEEFERLMSTIWINHEVLVVDSQIVEMIRTLSDRKMRALAVTNTESGCFGHIPKIEEWNVRRLQKFGIDFSGFFPGVGTLCFDTMKSKFPHRFPVYHCGVIHTCAVPKGAVLGTFLERTGFRPSTIIFVDDKRSNLETVETLCAIKEIPFIGFHYIAVEGLPCEPLDEPLIAFQMDTLEKEGVWLDSHEALRRQTSRRPTVP
jgi:hypothetical protein